MDMKLVESTRGWQLKVGSVMEGTGLHLAKGGCDDITSLVVL